MEKEKIEELRLKLEKEREELVKKIEELSKEADFGDDTDSFDEEADEAEDLSNRLGIGQSLRERVSEIDSVLNKIAKGETSEELLK